MAQLDSIRLSGVTYNLIDSTAVHSLDGYYTTGETNAAITAATDALAQAIAEQGYQTSGDVQNAISGKANSDDVYTKQETEDKIDEKIAEASGVTTGQVQTMIDESISGKANTSDVVKNVYIDGNSSGQTSGNNGQLNINIVKGNTTGTIQDVIGAKDGLYIQRNSYNGADIYVDFTKVAKPSDIPSVTGYADSVRYEPQSQEMKFYHGGTGGTEVFSFDASPFLIDGMVQNVEIKDVAGSGTCLVISFNTDAGHQDINIPISDIFDASNYYTKAETDTKINQEVSGKVSTYTYTAYTANTQSVINAKADTTAMTQAITEATSGKADTTAVTQSINEAVSGKADTTAVTQSISEATSGKVDTTTYTAYTAATDTALSGKQETLVNQTNIKSINGNSLLGSGDLTIDTGNKVEVSGTTLVFL